MKPSKTATAKPAAWVAAAAIGLLAMPQIADAACSPASGNGSWDVYATVVTGSPGWNRCSVTVTNGNVSGTCVTHTGASNSVRGTLSIAANCRVSGSLTHTFAGGTRYTATISQATLGAGDEVIIGVARTNTGLAETFQGVRH